MYRGVPVGHFLYDLNTLGKTTANFIGEKRRLEIMNEGCFGLTGGQVPKFHSRCRLKKIA